MSMPKAITSTIVPSTVIDWFFIHGLLKILTTFSTFSVMKMEALSYRILYRWKYLRTTNFFLRITKFILELNYSIILQTQTI